MENDIQVGNIVIYNREGFEPEMHGRWGVVVEIDGDIPRVNFPLPHAFGDWTRRLIHPCILNKVETE